MKRTKLLALFLAILTVLAITAIWVSASGEASEPAAQSVTAPTAPYDRAELEAKVLESYPAATHPIADYPWAVVQVDATTGAFDTVKGVYRVYTCHTDQKIETSTSGYMGALNVIGAGGCPAGKAMVVIQRADYTWRSEANAVTLPTGSTEYLVKSTTVGSNESGKGSGYSWAKAEDGNGYATKIWDAHNTNWAGNDATIYLDLGDFKFNLGSTTLTYGEDKSKDAKGVMSITVIGGNITSSGDIIHMGCPSFNPSRYGYLATDTAPADKVYDVKFIGSTINMNSGASPIINTGTYANTTKDGTEYQYRKPAYTVNMYNCTIDASLCGDAYKLFSGHSSGAKVNATMDGGTLMISSVAQAAGLVGSTNTDTIDIKDTVTVINEESTAYGSIPARYRDKEAWPFAIFSEGEFLAVSDRWLTNWEKTWDPTKGAFLYVGSQGGTNTSDEKDYQILLRRDYALKENGKSESTHPNVSAMKFKTLTVDLGGHTFDSSAFHMITQSLKRGSGQSKWFVIKNGTINSGKCLYLNNDNKGDGNGTDGINMPTLSYTFENLNIRNVAGSMVTIDIPDKGGDPIKKSEISVTFNSCNIQLADSFSGVLINAANTNVIADIPATITLNKTAVAGGISEAALYSDGTYSELIQTPCETHSYTYERADACYVKTDATCVTGPVYYKSCVCGAASESDTFMGTTLDPDNHVIEGTGTCECGAIVTEYGVIPVEYTNATTYPFAVFVDGKFVTGLKRWTTHEDTYADTPVEKGLIHMINSTEIIPKGKNVDVLMRRDYTCSTSTDSNFNNFSYTDFLSINLDLGGFTFTNTNLKMFNLSCKGGSWTNRLRVITVKNGTITNTLEQVVTISIANSNNKVPGCTITFEDVDFKNSASYIINFGSLASSTAAMTNTITFKKCTFDRADTAKVGLFDLHELNAEGRTATLILDNCTVVGETKQADWLLEGTYGKASSINCATHVYDTTIWKSNGNNQHGNPCRTCSTLGQFADCSGGTATCMAKAHCSVCDAEYGVVNPDNHVKSEGTCDCGAIFTKYGVIPVAYADATTYPFAVFFDDKFVTGLKRWTSDTATTAEQGLFNAIFYGNPVQKGKAITVLMRRDYTCSTATDTVYGNLAATKFISVTVDLGGFTFTNTDLDMFLIQYKGGGDSRILTITVKNGTITNSENVVDISGANNNNTVPGCDITFEGVNFNSSKAVVLVGAVPNSPISITNKFTFKGCTFTRTNTEPLFDLSSVTADNHTSTTLILDASTVNGETKQSDWLKESTYSTAYSINCATHIYDTNVWESNGNDQHGNPCRTESCTALGNIADCSGGTATCMDNAVCTVCSTKYGDVDLTNHVTDTFHYEANSDGTHKKIYDTCNHVADEAEDCAWDNTHKCTLCTYQGTHSFGEWTADEATTTHTRACACTASENEPCVEKEDDNNCTTAGLCEKCDRVMTAAKAEHTFVWTQNADKLTHNGACDCGTTVKNEACESSGAPTCSSLPVCDKCEKEYGTTLAHAYGDLVAKVDPTCSAVGREAHYQCSACQNYFTEAKAETTWDDLEIAIAATAHSYGEPTYTWAEDNSTVTATRVCEHNAEHKETEQVNASASVTQQQTCTTDELTTYTATFTNAAFAVQVKKDVKTKDMLGHSYGTPTYTWADDNSTVTAERICEHNTEHKETETVNTSSEVTQEQECEKIELTKYTATFTNEAFAQQVKENVETKPVLGHKYGEPTYDWADDYSSVTATRVCEHNTEHKETETVNATSEVTQEQECEKVELTKYTSAAFANEAFTVQVKENVETKPVLGHSYGTPTYTWAEDNSTVTAERVCEHNTEHKETETVNTSSVVTQEQKCEKVELTTYTATFTKEAFAQQVKENVETKPVLGHKYGEPTYDWSDDYSSVTATRVCEHDNAHIETETVGSTSEVTQEQECEKPELTKYTSAEFTNEAFAQQIAEDVETKPERGHRYGRVFEAVEPTCSETGFEAHYFCVDCDNYFDTEKNKTEYDYLVIAIVPTNHYWLDPSYEWAEDNSECTATRVCKHNTEHVETETVESESEVIREASCTKVELTEYVAVFENGAFMVQINTDVPTAPVLPHVFETKRVAKPYLATEADCDTLATYYYSCNNCGTCEADDEHTFEYGGHEEHTFVNGVCAVCEAVNDCYMFEIVVDEIAEAVGNDAKFTAIKEAIKSYNALSDEDKALATDILAALQAAIDAYNEIAEKANAAHEEASAVAAKAIKMTCDLVDLFAGAALTLGRKD